MLKNLLIAGLLSLLSFIGGLEYSNHKQEVDEFLKMHLCSHSKCVCVDDDFPAEIVNKKCCE